MKLRIFLTLIVIGINFSLATCVKCSNRGIWFYPKQNSSLSLNNQIVIEGYAASRQSIRNFKSQQLFLVSDQGEQVSLKLLEINEGQMQLTQAIFQPEIKLQPNSKYTLKIREQSNYKLKAVTDYNYKNNRNEPVSWTTSTLNSAEVNAELKIKFIKTEVIQFGCGPDESAIFKLSEPVDDKVWFKTELLNLKTKQIHIYFLKSQEGSIRVGHGMCSGAFTFNRNSEYKVRFTPINSDGILAETSQWFEFNSPYKDAK